MKHVCDYGVWDATPGGGVSKMRSRRRRKAIAALLGYAKRKCPQARPGASLPLAAASNNALRPITDVPAGGGRRPQATANVRTRVRGVAVPFEIGAAPRALHPSRIGRNALRFPSFISEALRRINC